MGIRFRIRIRETNCVRMRMKGKRKRGGDTVNKVASPSQGNGQCGEWKGSQGHRQIALRSVLNTEDREGCAKQPKSVPSSR